jgi:hypothetical protein
MKKKELRTAAKRRRKSANHPSPTGQRRRALQARQAKR